MSDRARGILAFWQGSYETADRFLSSARGEHPDDPCRQHYRAASLDHLGDPNDVSTIADLYHRARHTTDDRPIEWDRRWLYFLVSLSEMDRARDVWRSVLEQTSVQARIGCRMYAPLLAVTLRRRHDKLADEILEDLPSTSKGPFRLRQALKRLRRAQGIMTGLIDPWCPLVRVLDRDDPRSWWQPWLFETDDPDPIVHGYIRQVFHRFDELDVVLTRWEPNGLKRTERTWDIWRWRERLDGPCPNNLQSLEGRHFEYDPRHSVPSTSIRLYPPAHCVQSSVTRLLNAHQLDPSLPHPRRFF